MALYTRLAAILAKIEATYGTDPVPTGSANAILCSAPKVTPVNVNYIGRDLVRPYFGNADELVGTRMVEIEFEVEIAGSGTAGTAPAYGPLLRACGLAETIIAATRVDYTPVSTAFESCTIYYYSAGNVLRKATGCRGTVDFGLNVGSRPSMKFKFTGLYSANTAATPGSVDYTGFKTPLAIIDANTADVTIGGTVSSTGAPTITGGTVLTSMGLEASLGNSITMTPLLGGEVIDLTQRSVTGKTKLDLTAAQIVSYQAIAVAGTLQSSVALQHGTTGGNKVLLALQNVQLKNETEEDVNGRLLTSYDLRAVPTFSSGGNDEFRLAVY